LGRVHGGWSRTFKRSAPAGHGEKGKKRVNKRKRGDFGQVLTLELELGDKT